MLSSVDAIIEALGGPAATAELAGIGTSAISNWKARGFIPPEHFLTLSDELERRGKLVDRTVFGFRVESERAE